MMGWSRAAKMALAAGNCSPENVLRRRMVDGEDASGVSGLGKRARGGVACCGEDYDGDDVGSGILERRRGVYVDAVAPATFGLSFFRLICCTQKSKEGIRRCARARGNKRGWIGAERTRGDAGIEESWRRIWRLRRAIAAAWGHDMTRDGRGMVEGLAGSL